MKRYFLIDPSIVFYMLFFMIICATVSSAAPSLHLISPSIALPEYDFPVVFHMRNPDGSLSSDTSSEIDVTVDSIIDGGRNVSLKHGVGYLSLESPPSDDFTVSVSAYGLLHTIEIVENYQTVYHEGLLDEAGETWDSSQIHVITGAMTVPEGAALVIEAGSVILIEAGISMTVNGTINVNGSADEPVMFTSNEPGESWGGIEIVNGEGEFTYCFFLRGGGDQSKEFGHSHSQPVLFVQDGNVVLDQCYFMYNAGKAFGGLTSRLTIDNTLITRCDTGGEFRKCVTHVNNTHVLDIPNDDGVFIDDDNDGLYFSGVPDDTEEYSLLENSFIITTKDDGVDHNGARLNIRGTWIEGCPHEGIAASNANAINVYDTVVTGCGQGIEAGYGAPQVTVDHCVIVGNDIGLRIGDSYNTPSDGTMDVTNTIVYGNGDNIKNYDENSSGPAAGTLEISYSMTNDSEYDDNQHCITGTPSFDARYRLLDGSPGIDAGVDGADMGLIRKNVSSSLVINEILALNDGLYCDEYGDFDDWIELYNAGTEPVDVAGMFLSDNPDDPQKWRIPSDNSLVTRIEPHGYMIIWMDGETDQGSDHAGFRLSGSGEQLELRAADGSTVIDGIIFGEQTDNISFGREKDGSGTWRTFTNPTPGMSNDDADIPSIKEYFITCDPDSFALIYEKYTEDIYIPITLTYGSRTWHDVRMRIRGETSRKYPKKSLRVVFDSAPFSTGRDVLIFNAEYRDITYLHQYLTSLMFRETGHPCFNAEYARLYLNGEFLGLYLNVENYDKDFLEAHGLDPDGDLYKAAVRGACLSVFDDVDYHWDKKTNSGSGNNGLRKFIEDLNSVTDEEYYDFAHENLNYDSMVNILAMNMLIINASTYYHNYYMYQDVNGTGAWTMIPWDLDKTLSSYEWDFSYQQSGWWGYRTPDNPFHERAIICRPILKDIQARTVEIMDTVFNREYLTPVVDSLKTLIIDSIIEDETDNVTSIEEWEKIISINLDFVESRYNYLQDQFENWPYSFRLERPEKPFNDHVGLTWHSSIDPNDDPVTYTLKFSDTVTFPESTTKVFTGLTDTTFVLPETPEDATYYWVVSATDGTHTIEGFDSRTLFSVASESVLPDTVLSDMTLDRDGSPYIVFGETVIEDNATLTVESGVTILMSPDSCIRVSGCLEVLGTPDEPVYITEYTDDAGWGGLIFDNTDKSSHIVNAIVEHSTGGENGLSCPAAITGYTSSVIMDGVHIEKCSHAVYFDNSDVSISNCHFTGGIAGEMIALKRSVVLMEGCIIENAAGDAVDLEGVTEGTITGCTIISSGDDGIDIGDGCEQISVDNVKISGCGDKGISIGQWSDAAISRCVITECPEGIAVFDGSSALINHVTLYGNGTSIILYENESGSGGGAVTMSNSLIAVSGKTDLSVKGSSSVIVSYTLSDTAKIPGVGNIVDDPLFVDPANGNFHLLPDSPCIDAGDPEGQQDDDGSRPDIGAFTFTGKSVVINEINYNSSPDYDSGDWIELYNCESETVDLSGWGLRDENDTNVFVVEQGVFLEPERYIILCNDIDAFHSVFPDVDNCIGNFDFGLSGSGEMIRLFDADGTIVDSLTYDDEDPWPVKPDGDNATLSLINPHLDNSVAHNWKESVSIGTPGELNDVFEDTGNSGQFIAQPFTCAQNFPNPFNASTTIPLTILENCKVSIELYTILGQHVETLYSGFLTKGPRAIRLHSHGLPNGIYFYKISAGGYDQTKQMMILK